jgi:hypothetical protein
MALCCEEPGARSQWAEAASNSGDLSDESVRLLPQLEHRKRSLISGTSVPLHSV